MPEGTKVDLYKALKREGKDSGSAARIAQAKTGEALATGKPPKNKTILGEKPKQKHSGNLGQVMRKHHNTKKMATLRSYKEA